jgi:hypothetical protein
MFCFSSYPVSRLSGLCLWWLSVPLMVVWPFRPFRLLRPIHLCLRLHLHRCLCVCCCLAASIRRFCHHLSIGSICRFSVRSGRFSGCVGHSGHSSTAVRPLPAISVTVFVGVSPSAHSGPVRWLRLLWPPLSGRLFRSRFIRSFFVRPPLCILAVSSLSFRTFRPLFGRRSVPLSSPFWAILWSFVTVDFWPLWPLIVFHRHC